MLKVKGKHRNIVEYDFFPVIGKKNNQSSVSHVDQEIPTHGSMDGAGNLINLVFGVPIYLAPWPSCGGGGGGGGGGGRESGKSTRDYPFTLQLGFLHQHRRLMIDSIYLFQIMLSPNSRNSAMVSFDGRDRQEISHGDW